VSCSGRARIVAGPDAAALNQNVRERILTEAGLATMGRFLEAHEDVTIEITPTKWLSWQMDPIFEWFDDEGIELDNRDGEWMVDLTPRRSAASRIRDQIRRAADVVLPAVRSEWHPAE